MKLQQRFFPFEFEVWQGDEMVASASGPRDDALREAIHYVAQYEQDGPVRVFEITRTLVMPNADMRVCANAEPNNEARKI